jgi:hypothetical protein
MGLTPESFADVFERLGREGVRYVVVGGVADFLHGRARAVGDLDIVVDPAPAEAGRAAGALAALGFVPTLPLPLSELTVLRMFDAARREVDVFVRYPVAFEELWAGARRVGVGEAAARVASPEHLLRAQRFYEGRPAPADG